MYTDPDKVQIYLIVDKTVVVNFYGKHCTCEICKSELFL